MPLIRVILLILAIVFFGTGNVRADCEKTEELGRINLGNDLALLACGSKDGKNLNDLEIFATKNAERERLFVSDDAFKTYRLRRNDRSFVVSESLSGYFDPFIEIIVSCIGDECKAVDGKALVPAWPAGPAGPPASLQKEDCENVGPALEKMFKEALRGNKPAAEFFLRQDIEADIGCSAEASEAYMTYMEDIKRLRKLRPE